MLDTLNHEISSEYMGEKRACLSFLPMYSVTVLSGFWGVSVCCYVKPNTVLFGFTYVLEGKQFLLKISFTFRVTDNS